MIAQVEGDIFVLFDKKEIDILVHQANAQHVFGGGLALEIKNRYPEAYKADCKTEKNDWKKLGTFSYAQVSHGGIVVNLYSQRNYGKYSEKMDYYDRQTSYDHLYDGLCRLRDRLEAKDKKYKLGLPYMLGCGLGGGNWKIVKQIITEVFCRSKNVDVVIVKLPDKQVDNSTKK